MNVVRLLGRKKLWMALLLIGAPVVAIRYALTPARIRVLCDQRFSQDVQLAIKRSVETTSLQLYRARGISEFLKKEYPCIERVSISYYSSSDADVIIKAFQPFLRITSSAPGNKEYLLTQEGQLIEKGIMSEHAYENIPVVVIEGNDYEQKRTDSKCIACLLALKNDIFEDYRVTWRSKTDILLQSRLAPILIIADTVAVHDKSRLTAVERIFTSDNERYEQGMRADIRLPDSIVCAPAEVRG